MKIFVKRFAAHCSIKHYACVIHLFNSFLLECPLIRLYINIRFGAIKQLARFRTRFFEVNLLNWGKADTQKSLFDFLHSFQKCKKNRFVKACEKKLSLVHSSWSKKYLKWNISGLFFTFILLEKLAPASIAGYLGQISRQKQRKLLQKRWILLILK